MVIQRKKVMSPPVETFLARIFWKEDDAEGIEQFGTVKTIALYPDYDDNDDGCFWHHEGTEESFYKEFAKDNKNNLEDFYAEPQ